MITIPAIFEDGVFKPQGPVHLLQGAKVNLVLADDADAVAIMKARFPDSFGVAAPEDADELQRIIDGEFGGVNPDDWR